jgi:hypothetical protein
MNRKTQFAALLTAALGGCLIVHSARSQSAGVSAGPRVALASAECDLGTIAEGSLPIAKFTVGNAGGRRLIVREDVCSACGPEEWIIEPTKSENLTIGFDAAGLTGSVRQVRRYTTNDPLQPRLTLVVRANVARSPDAIDNILDD